MPFWRRVDCWQKPERGKRITKNKNNKENEETLVTVLIM
jgi:hypothetical protein